MMYFKVSEKPAELIKDTRQSQKGGLRDSGWNSPSSIGVTQLIPKWLMTLNERAHFRRDIAPALCPVTQVQAKDELPNAVVGEAWCRSWHGCSNYHQVVLLGIDFPLVILAKTIIQLRCEQYSFCGMFEGRPGIWWLHCCSIRVCGQASSVTPWGWEDFSTRDTREISADGLHCCSQSTHRLCNTDCTPNPTCKAFCCLCCSQADG